MIHAGDRPGPSCGRAAARPLVVALLWLISSVSHAQTGVQVIRAAARVDPDGEVRADGLIVIRDGKLAQVGGQPPAGALVEDFGDAVVCPGLIDVHSALGAMGHLSESQSAIEPSARAADVLDRFHAQLRAALAAGVTTFGLAPDDTNLIGGRIAIAQTSGPDGKPALLSDAGPLKLSLSPQVFASDREPTSRSGALEMLRSTIAKARQARGRAGGQAEEALSAFSSGRLSGILSAPSGADVLAALELAREFGLKLALIHETDARLIANEVAAAGLGVIVGPLDLSAAPRQAGAAGVLEQAGVEVAIAGGLPNAPADSLRLSAAVAVRNGLSAGAARRAITSTAAKFLGVGERVGVLQNGRQADLVIFSGDPLDLRSRVLAVYVGGKRVRIESTQ